MLLIDFLYDQYVRKYEPSTAVNEVIYESSGKRLPTINMYTYQWWALWQEIRACIPWSRRVFVHVGT